uniref:Epimerase domain-containing protein n=1 Tax=Caenorhabditis japonica TaxID=281687 RepID=A0A8R1E7P8_CAEJA
MGEWGILENKWRFYQPLSFFPDSDFWLEFFVFVHIYLLAAFLAIREAIFDRGDRILKIKSELFSSPRWSKRGEKRRILVIGGDGTIGSEIVKLARQNSEFHCHVVVHHKNSTFFENFLKNDPQITVHEADLVDREQVLFLANRLKSVQFEVAVFAAGIMLFPECRTSDGVEMHNAVNVIGQTMLYELLHSDIRRTVFLSSATARMACFSKSEELLGVYAGPYQAYASSKLNLAVYVHEMVRRRHVSAISMHPGTVPGHLYRFANPVVKLLNATWLPSVMRSPQMAAALVLCTVFRDDFQPGAYYEDLETVNVTGWVPEKERHRIYDTIQKRIEMWTEH